MPFFEKIQNINYARNIIDDNNWQTSLQRYSELSEEERQILIKNYNELIQHIKQNEINYIANSSENEYDWILKLSYSANEANNMVSIGASFNRGEFHNENRVFEPAEENTVDGTLAKVKINE